MVKVNKSESKKDSPKTKKKLSIKLSKAEKICSFIKANKDCFYINKNGAIWPAKVVKCHFIANKRKCLYTILLYKSNEIITTERAVSKRALKYHIKTVKFDKQWKQHFESKQALLEDLDQWYSAKKQVEGLTKRGLSSYTEELGKRQKRQCPEIEPANGLDQIHQYILKYRPEISNQQERQLYIQTILAWCQVPPEDIHYKKYPRRLNSKYIPYIKYLLLSKVNKIQSKIKKGKPNKTLSQVKGIEDTPNSITFGQQNNQKYQEQKEMMNKLKQENKELIIQQVKLKKAGGRKGKNQTVSLKFIRPLIVTYQNGRYWYTLKQKDNPKTSKQKRRIFKSKQKVTRNPQIYAKAESMTRKLTKNERLKMKMRINHLYLLKLLTQKPRLVRPQLLVACLEQIIDNYISAFRRLLEYCHQAANLMSQILRVALQGSLLSPLHLYTSNFVVKTMIFLNMVERRMQNFVDIQFDVLRQYNFLKIIVYQLKACCQSQSKTTDVYVQDHTRIRINDRKLKKS